MSRLRAVLPEGLRALPPGTCSGTLGMLPRCRPETWTLRMGTHLQVSSQKVLLSVTFTAGTGTRGRQPTAPNTTSSSSSPVCDPAP